jgi:hypothetical protein
MLSRMHLLTCEHVAGILFEQHRGHMRFPVISTAFDQVFNFGYGMVGGLLNNRSPGSWHAYAGLSSLAVIKLVGTASASARPAKIDRLGAFGCACAGWLEAASLACMVALQRYYSQVRYGSDYCEPM